MNARKFGKFLIVIGILLVIAYIAWIVFRVVERPQEVEQGGLLPNPFSLIIPGARTDTPVPGTVTGTPAQNTDIPAVVPIEPERRLFRVSSEPVVGYELLESTVQVSETDPLTGVTGLVDKTQYKIRYATRDQGFIVDTDIVDGKLTETEKTKLFISGLEYVDFTPYYMLARYRTTESSDPTSIVVTVEKPRTAKQNTPTPVARAQCRYTLPTTTVKSGATGRDIESLQSILSAVLPGSVFTPGLFDAGMVSAVQQYQNVRQITPASGIVGPKTLSALNTDCSTLLPRTEPVQVQTQASALAASTPLPAGVMQSLFIDDTRIFNLQHSGGANRGIVRDMQTGKESELYSLGFVDWHLADAGDSIFMTTRASGAANGYMFGLSPFGALTPIIQNQVGLATRPDTLGRHVAYSTTEGGLPNISVLAVADGTVDDTGIQTFAEKCGWPNIVPGPLRGKTSAATGKSTTTVTQAGSLYCLVPGTLPDEYLYPDEWYKHGIDGTDTLVRYDMGSDQVVSMDTGREIPGLGGDGVSVQVSSDESYLFFRDQESGYVYGYRLK